MNGSIRLHEKLGVNPKLIKCLNCNDDTGTLALIGTATVKECVSCKKAWCPDSKLRHSPCCDADLKVVPQGESIYTGEICDNCKKAAEGERAAHKALVVAGGIYWRCADCHQSGVIRASSKFAADIRAIHGIEPPGECGVEFTKADCPICGPKEESNAATPA